MALYLRQFEFRADALQSPQGPARGPVFLESITSDEEIQAMIAAHEQRKALDFWRDKLRHEILATAVQPIARVEVRLVIADGGLWLESRNSILKEFRVVKRTRLEQMECEHKYGQLPMTSESAMLWAIFQMGQPRAGYVPLVGEHAAIVLNRLLRNPILSERVLTAKRLPFKRAPEPLRWAITPDSTVYELALVCPDGSPAPPLLAALDGFPALYISEDTIWESPPIGQLSVDPAQPNRIPAAALESSDGVSLLERLAVPLPKPIRAKVRPIKVVLTVQCLLSDKSGREEIHLRITADFKGAEALQIFAGNGWLKLEPPKKINAGIFVIDRGSMPHANDIVTGLGMAWNNSTQHWQCGINAKFPERFSEWLAQLPADIVLELDPVLDSLRSAPLAATLSLDVTEKKMDWFDIQLTLKVSDTEFTEAELKVLLNARGKFVRLGAKGWRRLAFELSEEDELHLADLGLNARQFSGDPMRVHAIQLAHAQTERFLSKKQAALVKRRAKEIQTRVTPAMPTGITAQLRPYQLEGFHFLAYLATNSFGGLLADDMGLGKTLQTLTWLAWLRAETPGGPSVVVCPKSVVDNWEAEALRFLPGLRVKVWKSGHGLDLKTAVNDCDLLVINYTQIRLLEEELASVPWQAVILDEAQFIKNPASQTFKAACKLQATHRLALSGTPIENRLLDLWSIMTFAMPGVLGPRAEFGKLFDQRTDPLARRRLAARVRPFVLRRTKKEVASELPDRIEEDLTCALEGAQAVLYMAELKTARQHLLNLKTARELDKARFNVLTSLLRLRQICCHPQLVNHTDTKSESAKLNALLELLEPIMEEGHKVLVFSQFVEMLNLIESEVAQRDWKYFKLTGETEDRGALVKEFQACPDPAVFLISLRAGGFGLNLTAASYVVLFDPWWNPAAENQAIDRTHRIGQTNQVIAYRLIVKDTIEEKIRALQRQKSALSNDVLGEETFAKALSLEDFRFLLG